MAIFTQRITELEDLVRQPVEREWLELKSWVDLTDNLTRANTARHLAAISNFGGGHLVFGFNKDGSRCDQAEGVKAAYSHDVLAGIIEKYLHPKFQCEVAFQPVNGVEHPVVWIPSHGAGPVIAKVDGPQNEKGKVQGINSGVVYIRTPKPESVPATLPEHWDKIIQRCVLSRRDELVTMFSAIVSGGTLSAQAEEPDDTRERLTKWHQTTQRAAIQEAGRTGVKLRYPLADDFVQFSYIISHKKGEQIGPGQAALAAIEKLNTAVRDTVRTGWSMFYPFTRKEIRPRFATDPAVDGGHTEFVQTSLHESDQGHGDFWRFSFDGRASLLRNFHEDRFSSPRGLVDGKKWFDPFLQAQDITEIVRHARAYAEEFSEVSKVCFLLEWKGLRARVIASHRNRYDSEQYAFDRDGRQIYQCFPLPEIIGDLPGVVARLFSPVYRMANPRSDFRAENVTRMMKDFIVPGV